MRMIDVSAIFLLLQDYGYLEQYHNEFNLLVLDKQNRVMEMYNKHYEVKKDR